MLKRKGSVPEMEDYLTFEGQIVPMIRGKTTYSVLSLPDGVLAGLETAGARWVGGEFGASQVDLALTGTPVMAQACPPYTGKAFLCDAGRCPGNLNQVSLRPAPDAEIDAPAHATQAQRQAGAQEVWEALRPGRRRGLIHGVNPAKRAATRQRRIAKLIADIL